MRSTLGQTQDQAPVFHSSAGSPIPAVAPTSKEIPYDYVATFDLTGQRGNRVQDVINISVDGAYVAVAIGYSFIPGKLELSTQPSLDSLNSPTVASLVTQCLLVRICGIQFKYSLIDSGTGRELQNKPIHNIAGLGEANGERPFRPLAKPIVFMPRSTIRIEVEEVFEGPPYTGAQLYIVLHGYKILGSETALP